MKCKLCSANCRKAGKQSNDRQKYYCSVCRKYQQEIYTYRAYAGNTDAMISQLTCESVGIRGIGRILKISATTVISRIRKIAASIARPEIRECADVLEMDELSVFISNRRNRTWIIYVLERGTRRVLDFVVGGRSKHNFSKVLSFLDRTMPKVIHTDRFPTYQSIIPSHIHRAGNGLTNHIERAHLNLRIHIKRLARKTICYTRNPDMLEACLVIYFFGRM